MADRRRGASRAPLAGHRSRWETYAASAIGADHVRSGAPNQDAVAVRRFDGHGAAGLVVLAVADGHGNPRHFRSSRGAALAVSVGVAAAADWADAVAAGTMPSREAVSALVADVVRRWRGAVAADLAADPVPPAQATALVQDDPPEVPYGTTLLLAVIRADVAVLAQIGDGDILLVRQDGHCLAPVPGDERLDGTQTTSLCQPDAISAFRVVRVSMAKTPAYAIFAATDGYGNAQAAADWKARWARDLVSLGINYGARWIGRQLDDWVTVCASSDGSGDDATAALALNLAATLTQPTQPASPGDQADEQPGEQTARQTMRMDETIPADPRTLGVPEPANGPPRAPWLPQAIGTRLVLLGVVVVACVLAAYLYLRSPGSAPSPSPTTTCTPAPHHPGKAVLTSKNHHSCRATPSPSPTTPSPSPTTPSPSPTRTSPSPARTSPSPTRTSPNVKPPNPFIDAARSDARK